jgi:hypothetical protein
MSSASCRCSSRRCERVKLPLEVATFNVVAPLALALDGYVALFAITTVVEFGPEVSRSNTHCWYMWCCWRTCS